MSEGKGFPIILKVNLPPEDQYHSGHSLIVQGDTVDQVGRSLAALCEGDLTQAHEILQRFTNYAHQGIAVQEAREEMNSRWDS